MPTTAGATGAALREPPARRKGYPQAQSANPMPDPAPELHNLAADVRRVASAGGEVALHVVFAREWPALGIAAGLGCVCKG